MKDPAEITPEELAYWEGRSDQKGEDESQIEKLENKILELQEFAIWLTGCGYDFTQHEYFNQQRDKLLK